MGPMTFPDEFAMDKLHPSVGLIWRAALPGLNAVDQALLRAVALAGTANVESISGAKYVATDHDPFILAMNHNTRLESLFVPALLVLLRGGQRIHFLADWNFRMIPGLDLLYRRAGVITVPNKPARPRLLNVLKPLFTDPSPPMVRAREVLLAGASIGIFPEGKVNPDSSRLLRGRLGAARLSLETGVPIVPAGLVLPSMATSSRPKTGARMNIVIGPPITPPVEWSAENSDAVRAWHAQMMTAIAKLSSKSPAVSDRRLSDENVRNDKN